MNKSSTANSGQHRAAQRRLWFWLVISASIVTGLAWGLQPKALLVESALAKRASLRVTIEQEGLTRVKDRFRVSAPVAGYMHRSPWEVGDTVTPDQVLVELEPLRSEVLDPRHRAEAQARVAAAEAALAVAQQDAAAAAAHADFTQQELARKERLQEQQYIADDNLALSRTEQRRAQARLSSARFSVEVAKHNLNAAETALHYSAADQDSQALLTQRVEIRAPIAGVVLQRLRESEGVVQAGSPLLELGDPHALEIAVDVLSFDAVRIEAGMAVELERWGGDTLTGHVRRVEPVGFTKVSALGVEEQRVWVIVDFDSPADHWARLGDGYRVEARFLLWEAEHVLQVPNVSLFKDQGQWAVYVVEQNRVELRQVSLGHRNGLSAEILAGINEGERVVIHPDAELYAGRRVQLRE